MKNADILTVFTLSAWTNLGKYLLLVWLRVSCSTRLEELSLPLCLFQGALLNNVWTKLNGHTDNLSFSKNGYYRFFFQAVLQSGLWNVLQNLWHGVMHA